MFDEFYGGDVAAFPLLQEPGAVAADVAFVVYADGVGSVVSNDVVDAGA